MVLGTINAQLDQSYPGNQLTVEIIGVEKVKFTTNQGKHSHTVKNKHEVVHTTSVIQIFQNGILCAGYHSFPFAVELPNWLQSSFVYTHGYPDQSKHRLKYKLRAKILDGSCNQKPMHPMISKKMLVVSRIPDNPRFNVAM